MPSLTDLLLLTLGVAASGVSAASAGCGKQPPSSGTKNISNRQYILQVPANYDPSREYKLIFGLHWLGGNMNNVAPGYYGLRNLAGESAIFVAPNGLNAGWNNEGGADVRFIDQILAEVQGQLCVDETQIFSTGFSFGGAMSSALACARPNVFRAVSVIAGGPMSGCDGGTQPVAYLGIHGTSDSVVPVSWGRDLRDRFLRNNGCQSKNAPEPGPGGPRMKTEYSCQAAYPVEWIAHNGDHVAEGFEGGTNWMATETWRFFTKVVGDGPSPSPNPNPNPEPTTNPNPGPSNPPGGGNCSARWGQCGGQGWNGPSCCQSGSTCREQNPWYSQCL